MPIINSLRFSAIALLLTVLLPAETHAAPVKLFILAGTSNMLGHGTEADLPSPWDMPQEDDWIWQNDLVDNLGFTALRPGFGATDNNWGSGGNGLRCTNGIVAAGRCGTLELGPELTLGRELADAFPDHQIALVKHAGVGAVAVEWHPDTAGPGDQRHNYAALTEKMEDATQALLDE